MLKFLPRNVCFNLDALNMDYFAKPGQFLETAIVWTIALTDFSAQKIPSGRIVTHIDSNLKKYFTYR